MDLSRRIHVPAPVDEVWSAANDPSRIAAVLPGAVVERVSGDDFDGTFKIKLGSTSLALTGSGRYESRDAATRTVVVTTTGADRRGDATVEARHTVVLSPASDDLGGTDAVVDSSLAWGGRPGRLGDGVIGEAVERVLGQVQSRIAARVAEGLPWVTPAAAAVVDHPVELGADLGAVDSDVPRPSPAPSPGPSPRPSAPSEPKDYVYRPFSNTAEPHVTTVRTLTRLARSKVLPYAGLGALAVLAAASAVRRARR